MNYANFKLLSDHLWGTTEKPNMSVFKNMHVQFGPELCFIKQLKGGGGICETYNSNYIIGASTNQNVNIAVAPNTRGPRHACFLIDN